MTFATTGGWFCRSQTKKETGALDFLTATKKVMIVTTAPVGSEEFVDDLTELTTQSGYTAGYGGSGRLAMTTGSFSYSSDVSDLTAGFKTNLTYSLTSVWTAIGTPGTSIAGFVIITEITNDAASIPWIFLPFTDGSFTLTGADRTLDYPSVIASIVHGLSIS